MESVKEEKRIWMFMLNNLVVRGCRGIKDEREGRWSERIEY